MANSIIGLVNGVIDAINDMFHHQFNGLSVMGITLIPALYSIGGYSAYSVL